MKKFLLMLLVSVGLVALSACGNDESSGEEMSQEEWMNEEYDDAEGSMTDDPLELATDNSYDSFSGSYDDFDITRYTSDEANEDGLIELDVEGYEIKFTVVAGESQYGDEDVLLVVGEQENTNDEGGEMQMNRYEITTSEGEKLDDGDNFTSVEPGIKDKVANEFALEYDIPDEIELHIESIYDSSVDNSDYEYANDPQIPVDKTFTFTKE